MGRGVMAASISLKDLVEVRILPAQFDAPWCNGNIHGFDPCDPGPNPGGAIQFESGQDGSPSTPSTRFSRRCSSTGFA